jgi:hypothetical protein
MGPVQPDENVARDQAELSVGLAVVPGWIMGLRDPDPATADEYLAMLWAYIVAQGSRYVITPLCIPLLVEAARDQAVQDRAGVVFLIKFCATGIPGSSLSWEQQRDLDDSDYGRASWNAVAAEHEHLRELLTDPDRVVAGAALAVLAWTGDASPGVLAAIRAAIESGDERDQCTGWLASVVLGQLPPSVAPPRDLASLGKAARFGAAVAALRFAGADAPPGAVDELCSVLAWPEPEELRKELKACEFLVSEEPESIAASALGEVPAHLRGHANTRLLALIVAQGRRFGDSPLRAYLRLNLGERPPAGTAITLSEETREALTRLLGPLASWQDDLRSGHGIQELEEYGLPGTVNQLAAWLAATAS